MREKIINDTKSIISQVINIIRHFFESKLKEKINKAMENCHFLKNDSMIVNSEHIYIEVRNKFIFFKKKICNQFSMQLYYESLWAILEKFIC